MSPHSTKKRRPVCSPYNTKASYAQGDEWKLSSSRPSPAPYRHIHVAQHPRFEAASRESQPIHGDGCRFIGSRPSNFGRRDTTRSIRPRLHFPISYRGLGERYHYKAQHTTPSTAWPWSPGKTPRGRRTDAPLPNPRTAPPLQSRAHANAPEPGSRPAAANAPSSAGLNPEAALKAPLAPVTARLLTLITRLLGCGNDLRAGSGGGSYGYVVSHAVPTDSPSPCPRDTPRT